MTYPWLQDTLDAFLSQLGRGRQPHAILLCGSPGLGKRQLALEMCAALLCLEPAPAGAACGKCASCRLLASGAHPDFRQVTFEAQGDSERLRTVLTVEQIRDLIASMQLTNGLSPRKVALIFPAEAMHLSAANALLKTLEEPPGDTVLILVSHNPGDLPATIRSRCQRLHVPAPEQAVALQWLSEQVSVEAELAASALEGVAGSPLRALQFIETGQAERYRAVAEILDRLGQHEDEVPAALAAFADYDPVLLWNWFSLAAAARLRQLFCSAGRSREPGSDARRISALQALADRNRYLLGTPLRKDFLLREWLIQWSRLGCA